MTPARPGDRLILATTSSRRYAGGGRNTTSYLAASATTYSGFCSFMLWIAQNRS